MKKTIFVTATLLMLLGTNCINAQTNSFEIETDPTSFFSNGYNFNFGYSFPHWAIRMVSYKAELPEFLHGNEDFTQNLLGVGFDFDYFLNEKNNGFFVGPVILYSRDEIENTIGEKKTNDNFLTGIRIGYRFMPFKKQREQMNGFYITPFISPFYSFGKDVVFKNGKSFEYKEFQFWGGIHLGFRINTVKNK